MRDFSVPDKFRVGCLHFDQPVGVLRDTNELEYISCLLQSHPTILRPSGTLRANDVVAFLMSRHGVELQQQVVEDCIVNELAGHTLKGQRERSRSSSSSDSVLDGAILLENGDGTTVKNASKSTKKVLDICQMAAILVIPELLQAATQNDNKLFSAFQDELGGAIPKSKEALRKALVQYRLVVNGDDVSDELLGAMLDVSKDGSDIVAALTSDLHLFDLEWKNTNRTIFDDISRVNDAS